MTRCLSERRLLLCYSGESRTVDVTHLRGCPACAERFAHLRDDLDRIGRVLVTPAPALSHPPRAPSFNWRWAAVATAVLVAVIIAGLARPRSSRSIRVAAVPEGDASDFARDLDAALFTSGEVGVLPVANDEVEYLQAALGGGWPCTHEEMLNGECDGPVYALLADEE